MVLIYTFLWAETLLPEIITVLSSQGEEIENTLFRHRLHGFEFMELMV
jgi:hypothetical protein